MVRASELLRRDRYLRRRVTNLVALVEDDVVPFLFEQVPFVFEDGFVVRDDDAVVAAGRADEFGFVGRGVGAGVVQQDDSERRPPVVEVFDPLVDHRYGADDQDRAEADVAMILQLRVSQSGQEDYDLYGFAWKKKITSTFDIFFIDTDRGRATDFKRKFVRDRLVDLALYLNNKIFIE